MKYFGKFKIHMEVPYFLFGFSMMFDTSITSNFALYRSCYVALGHNKDDCASLGTEHPTNESKEFESEVQEYTAQILLIRTLSEAFLPPILCLFLAPWSDRYGRKPLMLLGITSLLTSYVIMTIVSSIPDISPWYIVLREIPLCFGGANLVLMIGGLSYVTDTTKEENRGIRLGFLDGAVNIGMLIGTLSSSYVFNAFGYPTIYATCVVCQLCSLLFTIFCIKESKVCNETEGKWRALIDVAPIKETIKIIFKKRPNNDRAILLCCFSLISLFTSGRFADSNVIYLYLLKQFDWSLQRYTVYLAIGTATWAICCSVSVVIILKLLRLRDTFAIIAAIALSIISVFVQGFATQSWLIYAAIVLKSMGSYLAPLTQSLVSRVAPKEEIAKMFAVVMASETVSILASSSLNTYVYKKTLDTFPQAFNLVTAGLYGIALSLAISISVLQSRTRNRRYS